jgi:hypothetical protein
MGGIVDFHVHSAPSLVHRHHLDPELPGVMSSIGVERFVMKAHEGSTAERAALVGEGAVGAVVLNSAMGGANPDAVEVAIRLGARVVWMPTLSARAHRAAHTSSELSAHKGLTFREVPVCDADGQLRDEWLEVIDLVAEHDVVLASGHIDMDEAVTLFRVASARGVRRMLVNHPLLPFLGWRDEHEALFTELGVHIEVGVLADILAGSLEGLTATERLRARYPDSLLVFGSDLGHHLYPDFAVGLVEWLEHAEHRLGAPAVEKITRTTGRGLLDS